MINMDIWLTDIVKSTMKKVSKSLFNNQKHQEDNIKNVVKQVSEHFNSNFLTNLIDTKQYKLIAPISEAFGRVYSKFETNKPEYINSFNKYLKAIKEAVKTNFEVDNNYINKIQDTISEVKKITSNEPMYDNLIETLIDEEEELEEQPAYAGSRVDYDVPSLDAIGSGEGHAAHGWGLYYAKNKDVASGYRDKFVPSEGYIITELKINGIDYIEYFGKFGWNKSTLANDIEYDIKLNVCKYVIEQKKRTIKQSMIKVLKAFYEDIDYYISRFAQGEEIKRLEENRVSIKNIINNLSELPDSAFTYKITKGQIHKVELPEDEFLLDEDKDFDEQSKYIQNALTKLYTEKILKPEIVKRNKKMKLSQVSGTGKEIYDYISDEKGGKKNASLLLNQYGIKGITYDGRVDGRCYVIFNPDDVKVVDKLIKESKELTEAYITDQKGNLIYYTSSPDIMMTIIKNKFPKGARVFYDKKKKLYVFSDVFNLIHVQMLNSIIMNTNLYSTEDWNKQYFNEKEQSWEEGYLKEQYLTPNCVMFIIVPDDNFAEYTQGDGYTKGWFVKIDDMYAVCRNKEYHDCRDEVPMFNDVRWTWTPTDYYLAKKEGLTESIEKLDGSHNTPIYVSNSVYEITNLIKSGNLGQGIRICYDKEKNLFMWADVYDYTHIDIFAYVCKMGYYPESFTVKKRLTNLTQEGYNYFNFHISQIKITRNMWADEDGYNMFNCFQVGKFMCYWRSEFAGDDSMDIRETQFYDILSIDSPTMIGESKVQDLKEQIAYHGSTTKNIKYFASEKIRRTDYGHGFYFTDSQEMAYRYSDNSKGKGSIYKCEIPDDEYLLDLNNEIKNQSEYVIKALVNLISEFNPVNEETLKEKGVATGDDIYTSLMNKYNLTFGGKEVMTEKLYKAGIKGLKYLDNDHDCHCFVIFNSKDIEILGEQDNIEEQVAYHGTLHNHDKFSTNKIGSGNTGQTHGWGLYFTSSKKEAEDYKNRALKHTALYNGQPIREKGSHYYIGDTDVNTMPDSEDLWKLLNRVTSDGKSYTNGIKWSLKYEKERIESGELSKEDLEYYTNSIKSLKNQVKLAKNLSFDAGMVYRVELPDDEYLLKEDEYMSGQSPYVYKAIMKLYQDGYLKKSDLNEIGGRIYTIIAYKLVKNIYDNKAYRLASEKMLEYGIKGILSYDIFNGKQTKVFCIFSENDIKVLDKNPEAKMLEQLDEANNSETIFYHGSPSKNIKEWHTNNIFWTTDREFAETYGRYIYSAKLDLGNIFNILNKQHFDWLLAQNNGVISIPDENSDDDQDFEVCDYTNFMKWEDIEFDNWECVEQYLDIIKTKFDSAVVFEQGTENYVIFSNNQIHLTNDKPDIRRIDEKFNQLSETVSYNNINWQEVIDTYIKFQLETYGCIEPDDTDYIADGVKDYKSEVIQQALKETGTDNLEDWALKINDNLSNIGNASKELLNYYIMKICKSTYKRIYDEKHGIASENNDIYRAISSNKKIDDFINDLKQYGTGNCWGINYRYANAIERDKSHNNIYVLKGEIDDKNIDWTKTIALQTQDDSEGEIRLKINAPIHISQIILGNEMKDVDLDLNTGSKYAYDHYQRYDNLNESIYHATMLKNGDMFEVHQNPTKKEFWDLLNRSEAKDLRGILGINEPILYVWDSYYGTHKQIFDSIIGKDWKESDYVGCWFRKNDMGVFGFSKFTSDIKEKYYGKEPEKPISKDKLDKIIADDDLGLLNEDLEGLNRIAGFYWFDNGHFQLLKRKPEGVEKLDPEDNEFDYYHLDDDGLEEDNKARFGIQRIDNEIVCYIQAETKQKCLLAKKSIDKKFSDILINTYEIEWYNPKTNHFDFEQLDEAYVQHTTIDPKYNIEYNTDYIEFEPEMRFLDDYDVEWEVEAVKGENVFLRSKNNQVQVMTADDLNLEIDMEKWRCIWDERFYTKSDFERATGQKFPENITAR